MLSHCPCFRQVFFNFSAVSAPQNYALSLLIELVENGSALTFVQDSQITISNSSTHSPTQSDDVQVDSGG